MYKFLFLILLITACKTIPATTTGNPSEEEGVKKVINQLFDAMREGNGEKVSQCFMPDATLQSISVNKEGMSKLSGGVTVQQFADAVNSPHDEIWDERLSSIEIRIDGNMATAWTPYQFYRGKEFSHCGVNAFQLFKSDKGWKIFHIADTRRKTDCL